MNLGELEAAVHRGELPAWVARLSCGDVRERLLARALRRERHALEARPALVLPTLQRVCVGTPELQPLLEAWATEWAAAKLVHG